MERWTKVHLLAVLQNCSLIDGAAQEVHCAILVEENMVRLIAFVFVMAIVSPASAAPLAPIQQPDSLVTTVREACGAGMHRVNGVCVRTAARRQAARCAAGLRYVNGRCIR